VIETLRHASSAGLLHGALHTLLTRTDAAVCPPTPNLETAADKGRYRLAAAPPQRDCAAPRLSRSPARPTTPARRLWRSRRWRSGRCGQAWVLLPAALLRGLLRRLGLAAGKAPLLEDSPTIVAVNSLLRELLVASTDGELPAGEARRIRAVLRDRLHRATVEPLTLPTPRDPPSRRRLPAGGKRPVPQQDSQLVGPRRPTPATEHSPGSSAPSSARPTRDGAPTSASSPPGSTWHKE